MTRGSLEDPRFIERWFGERAEHLGVAGDDLRVHKVERLSRGVSRETWSVDFVVGGQCKRVMVRRDHPSGGLIPIDLRDEYEVYARLSGTDVPIARAMWFEEDPEWLPDGRVAYVRDLVEGDWRLPTLAEVAPEFDEVRIALSKEHVSKLALVHLVDWRVSGFADLFPVPRSPEHCARHVIDLWVGRIRKYRTEPSPLLAEAVASLRERAPQPPARVVLCKGNNGLGEEVWADGRIVALSDWELAAIGDPAYDFAHCQAMIPQIVRDGRQVWGLEQALDFYAECTGFEVAVESVEYYREIAALMQFGYTQHTRVLMEQSESPPLRFLWSATEAAFRSELKLARRHSGDLMKDALA